MKSKFDATAFFAALDAHRASRGITWRQVAEESGVSASTLTRMAQGKRPDVDGLAALSSWSGLDANAFMGDASAPADPLAQMTAILHSDHRLSSQNKSVIEHMLRAAYQQMQRNT